MILSIVHVTDLHAGGSEISEFVKRRDALIADVNSLSISPNLLLVSGDVSFSGLSKQYELANQHFFGPFMDAFGLQKESVVVCPGNHDIDRLAIADIVRAGVATQLDDTETVQALLGHPEWIRPQQEAYVDFVRLIRGDDTKRAYDAHVVQLGGVSIGIASFDSSWLCMDDDTANRIFLTRAQVGELADKVSACDLKIALIHHPLVWFHPSEVSIVQSDLRSAFDMILTGHLHQAVSASIVTPSADCLEVTAPSFFAGAPGGELDGYNIYVVDSSTGMFSARFRKLIRARSEYDSNVEHAHGGEFEYALPSSAFMRQVSVALTRTLETSHTELVKRMSQSLSRLQRLEAPVVVTPVVQEVHWKDGVRQATTLRDPFGCTANASCIVFAPPGVGSTIFLQDLCTRINQVNDDRAAVYVHYKDIRGAGKSVERLTSRLARRVGLKLEDLESGSVTLLVDDMDDAEPEVVETLLSIGGLGCLVLCLKNEVLFDALSSAGADGELSFLRLRYWGPSRLREFTTRYIQAAGMTADADAAVKFIWDSLSLSDLPVTPVLVALYLQAFMEFGGAVSSLSFVRLLELLEQTSLDQAEATSSYSVYNLRLMLRRLAVMSYQTGDFGMPRAEFETTIQEYFSSRALDVDAAKFVGHLETSGIVVADSEERISFSSIVFFNYYLSQAIEADEIDLNSHLQGLHTALRLGDSLAYYAGRHRDQEGLAEELMRCLEGEYAVDQEVTSRDLEKYILHLLGPSQDLSEKDRVAGEALASTVDYVEADEQFEKDQDDARAVGESRIKIEPASGDLERIAWNIMALKTFYNVFRNLEHIPAETKTTLLDRILDHHLQCNMALIKLMSGAMDDDQFTSLCGYMVTIGGEAFLAQNVGSASLQRTIESLLKSTRNDLKAFLLHCIYADLRLPGYAGRLEGFLSETESPALLEMGYFKVHELLVRYEGKSLPTELVSAFNTAFDRRQQQYQRLDPINLQQLRDKALNDAKKQFLQGRKEHVVE